MVTRSGGSAKNSLRREDSCETLSRGWVKGGAVSDWVDIGSVEELRTRSVQEVTVRRTRIALVHRDGAFSAISGACNHAGGPLGQGTLDGDYVVCPWHYWKFHG